MTMPMASAPAKLARVRASVVRNPTPKAPRLWTRTLTLLRGCGHGRGGGGGHGRGGGGGHGRGGGGGHGGVAVHRRRRRSRHPGSTHRPVEGRRQRAVPVAAFDPVVDE